MMHAPASLLLAAAGLAAVSAQSTTTIQALLPMADQQTLVGSVVSAGPTAATYLVRCPPGTDSNDCGFPKPFSLVSGPSTLSMIASNGPQATYDFACKLGPSEVADCTTAFTSHGETETRTITITSYSSYVLPVTVTAGLEKLSAATTITPSGPTTTPTPTGTGDDDDDDDDDDENADPSTSTSTGGMPRVTQNAVVLGAAAIVGGALLI